jgi:hypothetical protein
MCYLDETLNFNFIFFGDVEDWQVYRLPDPNSELQTSELMLESSKTFGTIG